LQEQVQGIIIISLYPQTGRRDSAAACLRRRGRICRCPAGRETRSRATERGPRGASTGEGCGRMRGGLAWDPPACSRSGPDAATKVSRRSTEPKLSFTPARGSGAGSSGCGGKLWWVCVRVHVGKCARVSAAERRGVGVRCARELVCVGPREGERSGKTERPKTASSSTRLQRSQQRNQQRPQQRLRPHQRPQQRQQTDRSKTGSMCVRP
jgi:hypothetical protein